MSQLKSVLILSILSHPFSFFTSLWFFFISISCLIEILKSSLKLKIFCRAQNLTQVHNFQSASILSIVSNPCLFFAYYCLFQIFYLTKLIWSSLLEDYLVEWILAHGCSFGGDLRLKTELNSSQTQWDLLPHLEFVQGSSWQDSHRLHLLLWNQIYPKTNIKTYKKN